MAIPTVFSPVLNQDFTLNPIQVHKKFVIGSSSYATTGSGYRKWDAIYKSDALRLQDPSSPSYPTNSIDGTYKHIIWKLIDAQYYRFSYDTCATVEHSNPRYVSKQLYLSASILSIPQHDFGESIKPGSVEITASSNAFYLRDDGNGNLYDSSIDTGSFPSNSNLVAYWNFNDAFRNFAFEDDAIFSGDIPYTSRTFTPDSPSYANRITLSHTWDTVPLTGSRILGERMMATFNYWTYPDGDNYVITDDRPEFNFYDVDDFTIAFWMKMSDSTIGPLISKNTVVKRNTLGQGPNQKEWGSIQNSMLYSQSYVDDPTNVYPYDLYTDETGTLIHFKRSDGINITHISGSVNSDSMNHICVSKSGSLCSLYVNGALKQSTTDRTSNPGNNRALMFGARGFQTNDSPITGFQEIRMYNRAFPASSIQTLAASQSLQMLQSATVGNIFYRTGNVVLTSHIPQYREVFSGNPTIRWKSTHTIYEYEILCRVKKGSFNLSQNPTLLQSPNSDLIGNDFTGSLADAIPFSPYATSIGLYNDRGELMAVAKLGQAIQMRQDVDINFVIRMDA